MNVHFTARQTTITPEIRQFCEKRLKALGKLLGSVIEVDIVISVEKYRHKVDINVKSKQSNLVVVEETHDMFDSLNLAFDNLEKKIKKEKDKFRERKRRRGREKKSFIPPVKEEKEEKRIIRSEGYSLKPMSLEEALIQFDLNKKEVFVFRKIESEKMAVLYRRKNGHYGLVDPE